MKPLNPIPRLDRRRPLKAGSNAPRASCGALLASRVAWSPGWRRRLWPERRRSSRGRGWEQGLPSERWWLASPRTWSRWPPRRAGSGRCIPASELALTSNLSPIILWIGGFLGLGQSFAHRDHRLVGRAWPGFPGRFSAWPGTRGFETWPDRAGPPKPPRPPGPPGPPPLLLLPLLNSWPINWRPLVAGNRRGYSAIAATCSSASPSFSMTSEIVHERADAFRLKRDLLDPGSFAWRRGPSGYDGIDLSCRSSSIVCRIACVGGVVPVASVPPSPPAIVPAVTHSPLGSTGVPPLASAEAAACFLRRLNPGGGRHLLGTWPGPGLRFLSAASAW